MADYYTSASAVWKCGEECVKKVLDLLNRLNDYDEDPSEASLNLKEKELIEELYLPFEGMTREGEDAIWISGDENIDLEAVAIIVAYAQDKGWTKEPLDMQAAFTCSKPRLDAFGGTALIVHNGVNYWMNTNYWIQEKLDLVTEASYGQRLELLEDLFEDIEGFNIDRDQVIEDLCAHMTTPELQSFVKSMCGERDKTINDEE